jgi:tetrahydromethanopterin S-methyltransferase subunit G
MWESIMLEVDKNQNGTIDFDEFEEVMARLVNQKYHNLTSLLGTVKMKFQKQIGQKLGLAAAGLIPIGSQ